MKIGIVADDEREWHVSKLREELIKKGVKPKVFSPIQFTFKVGFKQRVFNRGVDLSSFNGFLIRRVPGGSLERVIFRMDTLHFLEDQGVTLMNPPSAIEKAVDKYHTSVVLERVGVRVPKTIVTECLSEALKAFKELGEDVLVKPMFGSCGVGIIRLNDEDLAYRVFHTLNLTRCVYYIQEFIPHGNRDIRAFVIGEEVAASMLRVSNNWKTNIASGGKPIKYDLPNELVELSVKASKALGCEYAGIDLLESIDGEIFVTEVNGVPAWQGLQSITKTNIAREIVNHFLEIVKK